MFIKEYMLASMHTFQKTSDLKIWNEKLLIIKFRNCIELIINVLYYLLGRFLRCKCGFGDLEFSFTNLRVL